MARVNLPLFALALLVLLLGLVGCTRLGNPQGWSAPAIDDGRLYFGTMDGEVRALELGTGQTVTLVDGASWSFQLAGEERNWAVYGTPAVDGDRLYVGGYDGLLYALTTDMEEVWEARVVGDGEPIVGSPMVSGGTVLIGSSDENLYAFNAADGALKWEFPTGGKVWSTPQVSDGVVYFTSLDHKVYAVRLEDGSPVWPSPFVAKGAISATPLVAGGRVYVGAFDSIFYALDARTGEELARFEGARKWFWAGAVASDDMVYAASLDGHLYALDLDTLEPRWSLFTGAPIIGSPVTVGDRVAVTSQDGQVMVAAQADGGDLWKCEIGVKVRASLVESDGVIYVLGDDHSLRALRIKANGNPDEEWVHFTNEEVAVPRDWDKSC